MHRSRSADDAPIAGWHARVDDPVASTRRGHDLVAPGTTPRRG